MKKLLTLIAAALFIVYPSISFASYVIHLKDGREYVTDRYWEEGDQIKFNRYGGVIGVQKNQVKAIEEKEDVPEEKTEAAKPETPPVAEKEEDVKKAEVPEEAEKTGSTEQVEEQQKPEEVSEEENRKEEQEKAAKIAAYLEEKKRLSDELQRVYSAFKEAKARGDKKARDKHFSKIKRLRSKLTELVREVTAAYGGKLPEWWNEPL